MTYATQLARVTSFHVELHVTYDGALIALPIDLIRLSLTYYPTPVTLPIFHWHQD
jgi:hypothetical protein